MYIFDKNTYVEAHQEIFAAYDDKNANRSTPLFEDGVVCPDKYQGILFLLKEAYEENCTLPKRSLIDDLSSKVPWGMWNHVAEWSYGLTHTTTDRIPEFKAFKSLSIKEKRDAIDAIAVINLKKVDGKPVSDDADIMKHTVENAASLQREIEIAKPQVIVCGGTMKYLESILGVKRKIRCDNWYYWFDVGNQKNVLVLDYCHPAIRSYSLLYYYGITNIYQQALIKKQHSHKKSPTS